MLLGALSICDESKREAKILGSPRSCWAPGTIQLPQPKQIGKSGFLWEGLRKEGGIGFTLMTLTLKLRFSTVSFPGPSISATKTGRRKEWVRSP